MIELKVDFFSSSVLIEAEIWNKNLNKSIDIFHKL